MANKTLKSLILAVICIFVAAGSARATVTGISSDGCPGTTCQPSFVIPVVAGKTMSATIKGQYVDLSTSIEVTGGSGVHPSISSRQGGNNSYVGVTFDVDPGAGLGERTVKLHYAIETNGPDTFKIRVVRGGRVDSIQQKVNGFIAGTTRLIAADAIPANQQVTLVFTGTRLGNALIAPIQAVSNPQTLSGCTDTRCEVKLEFTRTGTISINLYDADIGSQAAASLALSGTLYKFFFDGVKTITVTGTANPSPAGNFVTPVVGSTGGANAGFVDVAPRANMLNLFRRTGNSVTVNGENYLQVEDRWCQENGVQTPPTLSASKLITVPDIQWGVTNVGTAEIPVAFDSTLLANNQVLDTKNIAAGSLHTGATQNFNFHRTGRSTVRVYRFAPPNQQGCFARPSDTDFFEDPHFTVNVDIGNVVQEAATNRSNNSRTY